MENHRATLFYLKKKSKVLIVKTERTREYGIMGTRNKLGFSIYLQNSYISWKFRQKWKCYNVDLVSRELGKISIWTDPKLCPPLLWILFVNGKISCNTSIRSLVLVLAGMHTEITERVVHWCASVKRSPRGEKDGNQGPWCRGSSISSCVLGVRSFSSDLRSLGAIEVGRMEVPLRRLYSASCPEKWFDFE